MSKSVKHYRVNVTVTLDVATIDGQGMEKVDLIDIERCVKDALDEAANNMSLASNCEHIVVSELSVDVSSASIVN